MKDYNPQIFSILFITLISPLFCISLYNGKSPVITLNSNEFSKKVEQSNGIFLVEFFKDWCGHCQNFAPEFENIANALDGIVPVYATDDDTIMQKFGVNSFPKIKIIHNTVGKQPTSYEYEGDRKASPIISFLLKTMKKIANGRLGSNTSGSKKPSENSKNEGKKSKKSPGAQVIELTDNNFNELVINDSENVWFIEFYAPWCGHCKNLAPTWEELARSVQGSIKIGKVDATKEEILSRRFMIQGFPTLKLFPADDKSNVKDYDGPRNLSSFLEYVEQFASRSKKITQIVSDHQFKDECSKGVCLISFLPHILDSQEKGRLKYLKLYKAVAKASSNLPIKFFWAQAGDHFKIEEKLNLAFGYPAVVAISLEKGTYVTHRGDFSKGSLNTFISSLMTSQAYFEDLPKSLAPFNTIESDDTLLNTLSEIDNDEL